MKATAMTMMPLIDAHAHLHFDAFDADRPAAMARARAATPTPTPVACLSLLHPMALSPTRPGFPF